MSGTVDTRLAGKTRLFFDSNVIIYFIENHPSFAPLIKPAFEMIANRQCIGFPSYISLIEILYHPLKLGRLDLAKTYKETLMRSPGFWLFSLGQDIAEEAAEIRVRHNIKTPDAIQLATAIKHQADLFLTNDDKLKRVNNLDVMVLGDYA